VLAQAAGVSAAFCDRVVSLSRDVGQDAKKLLERLDAGSLKGWREKSTQELRDYLIREGYLDESDRLGPGQIREAVLGELSRNSMADRVTAATLDRVISSLPN
ncbi:MAG: hypothetical protein NT154_21025, partial [Verrucomicrobia bacterium]|nr:hypothetical protein [Verrucomicrobiota bacterium]